MSERPLVALVGRPNVGKSALFNRMIGERRAIVEDIAGTTRDRLVGEVEYGHRSFDLTDTGGVAEPTSVEGSGAYMADIRRQVESAVAEAELILFVVDSKSGSTSADHEVSEMLRRSGKTTLLVANKADNTRRFEEATEFYELGLGEPIPVSAINGAGVGELLDIVVEILPEQEPEDPEAAKALRVALVGRPNVGKSALVNAILGQQRVIVSDIAGTTRDAIDTPFEYGGEKLTLVDTAGIRRPGRVDGSIEHYSVMRSKAAIERADIAVCVFDASVRLRAQDLHVIGQALDSSTGLIVCGNKWDLMVEDYDRDAYMLSIRRRLRFVPWAPVVLTSALHGIGLDELLKEVLAAGEERRKRIPTSELNAILRGAMSRRPPPLTGKQRMKMLYATQVKTQPPTFILFVNDGALITAAYQRYLENALRKAYGFKASGLRIIFRSRSQMREE
jgi:GTP-binding protein